MKGVFQAYLLYLTPHIFTEEPQARVIWEVFWGAESVFTPISQSSRWPGYCNIPICTGILLFGEKNKDIILWEVRMSWA
jgi:hypothetical protein